MFIKYTLVSFLFAFSLFIEFAAVERVQLQSPLGTVWTYGKALSPTHHIFEAEILVPSDAPGDLACGAFLADRDMYWYQQEHRTLLTPGRHLLRFQIDDWSAWHAEPGTDTLSAQRFAELTRIGLFFYSEQSTHVDLRIQARMIDRHPALAQNTLLVDALSYDGAGTERIAWPTGKRWHVRFQMREMPQNPYNPQQFSCDLVITQHGKIIRIPGFYTQDMDLLDRGDSEIPRPRGDAYFEIRWRPSLAGSYQLSLEISAGKKKTIHIALPDIEVSGPKRDPFVRVDSADPRFLSTGDGDFVWPVGQNIAAVSDDRAGERYQIRATPKRGTHAYAAYFSRLAAHGVTSVEVWLSAWNVSLEWSPDRPHYYGLGRYNQFHAAQLEAMLDDAWSKGIRLVLNLRNHGQLIRPSAGESEWVDNPYNTANGGPCATSDRFFDNPTALAYQHALRRYQVARYADHPGVLTWKLWSEVDLTDAGIRTIRRGRRGVELLTRWHTQAANDWHALDIYDHPVSTHFATDMHNASPALCSLRAIDMILLDAYHLPSKRRVQESTLGGLMVQSMYDRRYGTARYGKPMFVTEYGGAMGDSSKNKLLIEHRTGRWQALMAGHAAAPMIWWNAWVDQGNHFAAFQAITRYTKGEDLRGVKARSVQLRGQSDHGELWIRAWAKPGHLLFYAQDKKWAEQWTATPQLKNIRITIGENVKAGEMRPEWWNADTGVIIAHKQVVHAGGKLIVQLPACSGHIAAKLIRKR